MFRLQSILSGKCPNCEKGKVYSDNGNILLLRLPKMKKQCDVCSYVFEKEPGYFWGAMYFSYTFTIAEGVAMFIIGQFFFEDVFDYRIVIAIMLVILLLSFENYRYSRLFWMYLFSPKKH